MYLNEDESVILSYCKGYLGFAKDLVKRLFVYLFDIDENVGYDDEVAYCLLCKEFYRLLKKIDPTAELSLIIFDELRVGYVYPDDQPFYKQLFGKLRGRLCSAPLTNINFEKKTSIY